MVGFAAVLCGSAFELGLETARLKGVIVTLAFSRDGEAGGILLV